MLGVGGRAASTQVFNIHSGIAELVEDQCEARQAEAYVGRLLTTTVSREGEAWHTTPKPTPPTHNERNNMKTRKIKLTKEQKDFLSKLGKTPVSVFTGKEWAEQNGGTDMVEELVRLKQVRWVDGELELFASKTWGK